MREAKEFKVDIGDVELSLVEWPGDSDPVLLLHATGFHSRYWTRIVENLPGQHIDAVDLRFHGASGAVGEVDWKLLADDIRLLIEQLDLSKLVGVGQSIVNQLIDKRMSKSQQMRWSPGAHALLQVRAELVEAVLVLHFPAGIEALPGRINFTRLPTDPKI